MGSFKDLIFDSNEGLINEIEEIDTAEVEYPKKLHVDGYDVNHYHDGDIPVYEILDETGNVIEVTHSTNEMHEFIGNRDSEDYE